MMLLACHVSLIKCILTSHDVQMATLKVRRHCPPSSAWYDTNRTLHLRAFKLQKAAEACLICSLSWPHHSFPTVRLTTLMMSAICIAGSMSTSFHGFPQKPGKPGRLRRAAWLRTQQHCRWVCLSTKSTASADPSCKALPAGLPTHAIMAPSGPIHPGDASREAMELSPVAVQQLPNLPRRASELQHQ